MLTSSPTKTGRWNTIASTAIVATRPRARRIAALPPARSISPISQPPKMSPEGLASAGMAVVRSSGAWSGGASRVGGRAGMASDARRVQAQDRARQRLRARDQAVELQVFLRAVRLAADRADRA